MQYRERVIDIKALFRCVVEKWRFLLLAGVLAGAALAGLKGYSEYKQYLNSQAQAQTQTAVAETGSLKEEELKALSVAEDFRNEYFADSLLSEINPHKEGKATADLIVRAASGTAAEGSGQSGQTAQATAAAGQTGQTAQNSQTDQTAAAAGQTGQEEPAAETAVEAVTEETEAAEELSAAQQQSIANYYSSTVLYRIDYTKAAEQLGVRADQLNELVSVTGGTAEEPILSVAVIYSTPEGAKLILDEVLDQVRTAKAQAESIYGSHELLIANEASGAVVDIELYKWANNRANEIMSLINSQKTLGNNLTSGTSAKTVVVTQNDVMKTAVKWGVTGLVAGILLAAVFVAVYLLAAGKVLSGREFNRHFGLNRIACVPGRKYTSLKGLDKWAGSIDSAYYNHPQRNVALQVADANIRAAVRPDAQIALVGDLPIDYIEKLAQEMNKSGYAGGMRTSYFAIPCLEQTPESVSSIVNCDAAVLVARAEKSTYKGAADVMDACALLGRDIVGSIVLM